MHARRVAGVVRHEYLAYLPPGTTFTAALRRALRSAHPGIAFDWEALERARHRLAGVSTRSRGAAGLEAQGRALVDLAARVRDALDAVDRTERRLSGGADADTRRRSLDGARGGLALACRTALAVLATAARAPVTRAVRRAIDADARHVRELRTRARE